MQYLPAHLKALRLRNKIKQTHIAAALGMNQSNYSKIERGEKKLNLKKLDLLARVFKLEAYQLLEMAKFPPEE